MTPHICVTVIQFVLVNTWTHLGVFKLISPECRIYASVNQVSLGSGNGLSPGRRQAITWTNAHLLSIRPSGIKFNENLIEIQSFSFMKMYLKMLSAKWRLGGNELNNVKWLQPVWWPLVHPNLHTNTGITIFTSNKHTVSNKTNNGHLINSYYRRYQIPYGVLAFFPATKGINLVVIVRLKDNPNTYQNAER